MTLCVSHDLCVCHMMHHVIWLIVDYLRLQLAKTEFMRNQDPLDSSLLYLAMKKKSLLKGLFRYMYMYMYIQ